MTTGSAAVAPVPGGRSQDLARFTTFVDAVVAIAITLLVLPLVDAAISIGGRSTGVLLRDVLPEILAFLLSFAVIARLWTSQHRIMAPVLVEQSVVSKLLLAWTLTVVWLPFPTALVATSTDERITLLVYVGTLTVSAALVTALAVVVRRDPAVRATGRSVDPLPPLLTTLGCLVAMVLSVLVPVLTYYPLLLLLLDGPLTRLVRSRRPLAV